MQVKLSRQLSQIDGEEHCILRVTLAVSASWFCGVAFLCRYQQFTTSHRLRRLHRKETEYGIVRSKNAQQPSDQHYVSYSESTGSW